MLLLPVLVSVLAICSTIATNKNGDNIPSEIDNVIDCSELVHQDTNSEKIVHKCQNEALSSKSTSRSQDGHQLQDEDDDSFDKKAAKTFFGVPLKNGRANNIDERAAKSFFGFPSRPDRSQSDSEHKVPSSKRKSYFGMPSMNGRSVGDAENGAADQIDADEEKRKAFFGIPWRDQRGDEALLDQVPSRDFYGLPNSITSSDIAQRSSKSFFGFPSAIGRSVDSDKRASKSFFGIPSKYSGGDHEWVVGKRKSFFGLPNQSGRSAPDVPVQVSERKSFFGMPSATGRSVEEARGEVAAYHPNEMDERASKSFFGMPMAGRSVGEADTYDGYQSELVKRLGGHRKAFVGMPMAVGKRVHGEDIDDTHARDRRSPETTELEDNLINGNEIDDESQVSKKANLAHLYARGKLYAGMPVATVNRSDRYRPQSKRSAAVVQALPTIDKSGMVEKRSQRRRKLFSGMPTAFRRARPNYNSAAITGKLFMGMPVPEF